MKRPIEHIRAQKEGKRKENNVCVVCGRKTRNAEGHHLIPFSECGPADDVNITAMCRRCHRLYHSGKLPIDIDRF